MIPVPRSLAPALVALLVAACAVPGQPYDDSGVGGGNPAGADRFVLAHMRVQVPASTDVTGFDFQIACDDGTVLGQWVPLEEEGVPEHLDPGLAGQPFADLMSVLPATTCTVVITPMAGPDTLSEDCSMAETTVTVLEAETVEVVLPVLCKTPGMGGVDIVAVAEHAPQIEQLAFDPGPAVAPCQTLTLEATASDADGDPVKILFEIDAPAPGMKFESAQKGSTLSFSSALPGVYGVLVTATDGKLETQAETSITVLSGLCK